MCEAATVDRYSRDRRGILLVADMHGTWQIIGTTAAVACAPVLGAASMSELTASVLQALRWLSGSKRFTECGICGCPKSVHES